MSFSEYLNSLVPVFDFFLKWINAFISMLFSNYFVLIFLGFLFLYYIIDIVFYLINNFNFNFTERVSSYFKEKEDLESKSLELAKKELIMRQNNLMYFDPHKNKILSLDPNINYSDLSLARKELIMRQNNLMYFDPKANNIFTVPDDVNSFNIARRNFKRVGTPYAYKQSFSPEVPWWYDKEIIYQSTTPEERKELDDIINNFIDD